jgi:hypothetical protein
MTSYKHLGGGKNSFDPADNEIYGIVRALAAEVSILRREIEALKGGQRIDNQTRVLSIQVSELRGEIMLLKEQEKIRLFREAKDLTVENVSTSPICIGGEKVEPEIIPESRSNPICEVD